MSIGPSSPLGYSLPASIVGSATRNLSETSQARSEAAQQNVQAGQEKFSVRDNEDVMETGLTADREVDGRLPYDLPPEDRETDDEEPRNEDPNPSPDSHRSIDPEGERGGRLDLEA